MRLDRQIGKPAFDPRYEGKSIYDRHSGLNAPIGFIKAKSALDWRACRTEAIEADGAGNAVRAFKVNAQNGFGTQDEELVACRFPLRQARFQGSPGAHGILVDSRKPISTSGEIPGAVGGSCGAQSREQQRLITTTICFLGAGILW